MEMLERFWSKVDMGAPDECWEWTAAKVRDGYGSFTISGKMHGAHRLAWQFVHGHIPEGMFICHHCDNPGCVNHRHLFLGTNDDNIMDAVKKGRWTQKLTSEEVLEIRKLLAAGERLQREIAKDFGVCRQTVSLIKLGKIWRWLEGSPNGIKSNQGGRR